MLKSAPLLGQQRRAYALKTKLSPLFPTKLAALQSLQEAPFKPITLIHHDSDKILWINFNASKEFDFGVVVFYTSLNEELSEENWPFKSLLQPILFLSCFFTLAKRNYWSTELEIAGFI